MNAETKIASEARAPSRDDPRPASAVSTGVGMIGLAGLFAWTCVSRAYGMEGPLAALTALVACGLPMILWSLLVDKVHRRPSTGIDWESPPRPLRDSLDISIAKIAGLWGAWAIIGAAYCIARWYWDGAWLFAMQTLGVASIAMLILSIPYVVWLDRRLAEPKDGAWHFGQLLIGRGERADRRMLHDFWRAWAVKAFFLAFMISIVPGNWVEAIHPESAWIGADPVNLARWLISVMFMIDVSFATVGYVLTFRPLDSHIRTANPYAASWTAALICYPPFIMMNPGGPLDYHIGTADWIYWLGDDPLVLSLTGLWLVFLTGIYAWATVAFGIRFSNLTDRGVLTHGPYAFSKHPAYLSKNIFWWCATLPFLATTHNVVDAIRNTVVLGLVSGVYYWRARTEERHLMADPAYRDYAAWMERNGPIPRLIARLTPPLLRPRPAPPDPVAAE